METMLAPIGSQLIIYSKDESKEEIKIPFEEVLIPEHRPSEINKRITEISQSNRNPKNPAKLLPDINKICRKTELRKD